MDLELQKELEFAITTIELAVIDNVGLRGRLWLWRSILRDRFDQVTKENARRVRYIPCDQWGGVRFFSHPSRFSRHPPPLAGLATDYFTKARGGLPKLNNYWALGQIVGPAGLGLWVPLGCPHVFFLQKQTLAYTLLAMTIGLFFLLKTSLEGWGVLNPSFRS